MKKVLLLTLALLPLSFTITAKEAETKPTYDGSIYGSVTDYFPQLKAAQVFPYYNYATSGIRKDIPTQVDHNRDVLFGMMESAGKSYCKKHDSYMLDHIELRSAIFGQYGNVFTEISGNVICYDK